MFTDGTFFNRTPCKRLLFSAMNIFLSLLMFIENVILLDINESTYHKFVLA